MIEVQKEVLTLEALSCSPSALSIGEKAMGKHHKLCLKQHINLGVPKDHLSCEDYRIIEKNEGWKIHRLQTSVTRDTGVGGDQPPYCQRGQKCP